MMDLSRKKFLTMFGALGVASTIPQAKGEGIEKYLTTGPNPEKRHYPIVNGWDNRPHYPVMENTFGEMGWEKKSPYEIVADIHTGVAMMQEMSKGIFTPSEDYFAIALPPSREKYLRKEFDNFGRDVLDYIHTCFAKADIICDYQYTSRYEDSGYKKSAEFSILYVTPQTRDVMFATQYGI